MALTGAAEDNSGKGQLQVLSSQEPGAASDTFLPPAGPILLRGAPWSPRGERRSGPFWPPSAPWGPCPLPGGDPRRSTHTHPAQVPVPGGDARRSTRPRTPHRFWDARRSTRPLTPHRSPSLEGTPGVARARAPRTGPRPWRGHRGYNTRTRTPHTGPRLLLRLRSPSSSPSPGLTIVLKNWFTFFLLSVFLSPSDRCRKVWLRRGDALASSVPGTPATESVRAAGEPRAAVRAERREGDRGRVGAKGGRDRVPRGSAAVQAGAVCVPGPRSPSVRFAEP